VIYYPWNHTQKRNRLLLIGEAYILT